jgi:hypothetical protein
MAVEVEAVEVRLEVALLQFLIAKHMMQQAQIASTAHQTLLSTLQGTA